MNYRYLSINDYQAVLELWKKTDGVGLRNADSRESIGIYLERNPDLSYVAEIDNKIIGTIMSGHDGRRGYLQHLAVDEEYRKQGIGEKLVELALTALGNVGIIKSHIHVFSSNSLGKEFWINRGWIERQDLIICSYINGPDTNA